VPQRSQLHADVSSSGSAVTAGTSKVKSTGPRLFFVVLGGELQREPEIEQAEEVEEEVKDGELLFSCFLDRGELERRRSYKGERERPRGELMRRKGGVRERRRYRILSSELRRYPGGERERENRRGGA